MCLRSLSTPIIITREKNASIAEQGAKARECLDVSETFFKMI